LVVPRSVVPVDDVVGRARREADLGWVTDVDGAVTRGRDVLGIAGRWPTDC
jgi:hypothetical protein